jgi:hypothetical protein
MGQIFPYVLPLRERQTVVLALHPDHIVGPARSTNIKPIFDGAPPCCHSTLFHARWCACGACSIGGEIDFRIRIHKNLSPEEGLALEFANQQASTL